jgi:hypothetical protein
MDYCSESLQDFYIDLDILNNRFEAFDEYLRQSEFDFIQNNINLNINTRKSAYNLENSNHPSSKSEETKFVKYIDMENNTCFTFLILHMHVDYEKIRCMTCGKSKAAHSCRICKQAFFCSNVCRSRSSQHRKICRDNDKSNFLDPRPIKEMVIVASNQKYKDEYHKYFSEKFKSDIYHQMISYKVPPEFFNEFYVCDEPDDDDSDLNDGDDSDYNSSNNSSFEMNPYLLYNDNNNNNYRYNPYY